MKPPSESWWAARPWLAHSTALMLCRRSAWQGNWRELCVDQRNKPNPNQGRPGEPWFITVPVVNHRRPPAPFYEGQESGCRVCGQPVYTGGEFYARGRQPGPGRWHSCCVAAWKLWTAPGEYRKLLAEAQRFRCTETSKPLRFLHRHPWQKPSELPRLVWDVIEVDHQVPLWRVYREAQEAWPEVLHYWGPGNLRALSRDGHQAKTSREAKERARGRHRDLFACSEDQL